VKRAILVAFVAGVSFCSGVGAAGEPEYLVYVASEGADRISLVRFGPRGGRVDHDFPTGVMPVDIDGPHGLTMSPDRRFYYVSLAHGQPFGSVWKYSTKDDALAGKVTVGMFPATMHTTPDGELLYVVNFNLHGDMVPSSVSVIETSRMIEIARITTCTMPHGSRLNPQGTKHYSACMMDDLLVEIDTATLRTSRRFALKKGAEACSPTWAQPSIDGRSVYVACNASNEIVEIDADRWTQVRRWPAGNGVYNLAVTKNGRLIATNKRGQSVSVFDTRDGRTLATIATKRGVVHGVVVSPDDRYAFVSEEGIGTEPGTVEMIDLAAMKSMAAVDVAPQAGGIDFYRIDDRN